MRKLFLALFLISVLTANVFSVAFLNEMFAGGLADGNGDPYSGYKVYAYYSESTVPQPMYTSRDQSSQFTQPITLDSRGAYTFYCNGVYKFVLRNPDDDTTILTFDEWDFTQAAENTFSLEDGSGNTTVYFTGPDGLNYVNSGNLGIGMAVPVTAIHINKPSPAIRFYDSSESIDVDVKFASTDFEITTVSGTTVESLLKVPVKLDEAPSGFLATPVGTVQMYAGSTAPDGWLLCQGQAVSRTTYSDLFSSIGTTYGVGDGATTFNVPDFRGRYARGSGTDGTTDTFSRGAAVNCETKLPVIAFTDAASGAGTAHSHGAGTYAADSAGAHSHTVSNYGLASAGSGSFTGGTGYNLGASLSALEAGAHGHTVSGASATESAHTHSVSIDGGGDSETRPYSEVVNFIIYTGVKY